MGKLLDALRQRHAALENHKKTPRKPYVEDPAGGYAYLTKLLELDYVDRQAGNILTQAVSSLSEQERKDFFDRIFSDAAKQEIAASGYHYTVRLAANRQDPDKALSAFFKNESNFGIPLEEVVQRMEALTKPETRDRIYERLGEGAPLADKAAALAMGLGAIKEKEFFLSLPLAAQRNHFHASVERSIENRSIGNLLRKDAYYKGGKNWVSAAEELEQIIGPERAEQLAAQVERIKLPNQDENRLVRPRQGQIDALRNGIKGNGPQAAQKRELLKKAEQILVYPSPSYLEYLDEKDANFISGEKGIKYSNNALSYHDLDQFLLNFQEGSFHDKLPTTYSKSTGMNQYGYADVKPAHVTNQGFNAGVELSQKELNQLREAGKGGIGKELRDTVLEIVKDIEKLGEKNYWNSETIDLKEGTYENPIKYQYKGEQGNKKYAFWPLIKAKNALDGAVEAGDWDRIRDAVTEYERCKGLTDHMMKLADQIAKEPTFPGNVNSTRSEEDGSLNPMPAEYLENFPAHSRVNGVFQLFAMSKNTNIPVARFLEDPVGIMRKVGQDFKKTRLLSSFRDKPLGARLALCFNRDLQGKALTNWSYMTIPFARGLETIGGLMPDAASRQRCAGMVYCALAAANYEVGEELTPWMKLAEAGRGQKELVTQLAILLPEEELDLKAIGLELDKPGWQQKLDPAGVLERLKREGKLDPKAIMERADQLLAEVAEAEKGLVHNDLSAKPDVLNIYRRAALNTFEQLLQNIPPDKRNTGIGQQLTERTERLRGQITVGVIKAVRADLGREIETLSEKKHGAFLSSKNSPAHNKMMEKLRLLNCKMDLMTGKPDALGELPEQDRQAIREKPLSDCLEEARRACQSYAFEKTKGGKSIILHEAGIKRKAAAMNSAVLLGEMEDSLGLRSPARKLMDNATLSALNGRGNPRWLKQKCERCAAGCILGMSMEFKKLPIEKQKAMMESGKFETALQQIREQPAFRRMVKNEGLDGLADRLVNGTAALTDAYRKAAKELETLEAGGPQPKGKSAKAEASEISMDDRMKFWEQREGPAILGK